VNELALFAGAGGRMIEIGFVLICVLGALICALSIHVGGLEDRIVMLEARAAGEDE
jgi:hypothetical protein